MMAAMEFVTLGVHDVRRSWIGMIPVAEFESALTSVCATCVFFFFQAEDGIRDDLVTGVQTCALPISTKLTAENCPRKPLQPATRRCSGALTVTAGGGGGAGAAVAAVSPRRLRPNKRSEERRVGEEGRSPWSAYH